MSPSPSQPSTPPELSFLLATRLLALFYISTKYHQNIVNSIQVTERTRNQIQSQGKITAKVRKPELSFLYTTCHLVLFYISTIKYHQNLPKGIHVKEQTRNQIQTQEGERTQKVRNPNKTKRRGDNSKSKKPKVGILVHDLPSSPALHFYKVS